MDDGNRTLAARDMELTQGAFLVSLISNGLTRIRLTGGYPCKNAVYVQEERMLMGLQVVGGVTPSDTDAVQRKSCGEERFGS